MKYKDKNGQKTDWELHKNITHICKECGDERKKDWQKKNKKLKISVGDYVKVGIEDKKINGTEHLWFEVIAINKVCPICKSDDVYASNLNPDYTHRCNSCGDYFSEFIGKCDNVPVVIENIKNGGITKFKFEDIEDYLKRKDL